jgi:hypothetical protein
MQQKWSRREESDFYRIVSTFGVQFDPRIRRYSWDTFRQLARLDKKYDDTLTEYFLGFYYMCCRVCKKLKEDGKYLCAHFQTRRGTGDNMVLVGSVVGSGTELFIYILLQELGI